MPRQDAQRKTFCRTLNRKYLAGKKRKCKVILDKTWVYLNECNNNKVNLLSKMKRKKCTNLDPSKQNNNKKKSFSKGFMIVAWFSYSGKLKIRRVKKNVKINSKYYQKKVFRPIFTKEIPLPDSNNFHRVKFHEDRATNDTLKSITI